MFNNDLIKEQLQRLIECVKGTGNTQTVNEDALHYGDVYDIDWFNESGNDDSDLPDGFLEDTSE